MGKRTKENKLRKKVMWCIDIAFVYLKWASVMWCIGIPLFLIDAWFWWYISKTEKQSLEHLSKQSVDDIRCWYMWDFLSSPKCSYFKYASFILHILEVQLKYALRWFPKKKYKRSTKAEKYKKVLCLYFNNNILLSLNINT